MTSTPLLTDGTVTLRAVEPDDIDTILAWENDTREWTSATTAAPFSRRNIEEYVLTYDADIFAARQLRLMIDTAEGTVGAADLFDFDPINRRAGIGVVTDRGSRRRGYASRAVEIMARYCAERIGIHQLWAVASVENTASRRLLEGTGFVAGGRLHSWLREGERYIDAYIYQRLLQAPHTSDCKPPRAPR